MTTWPDRYERKILQSTDSTLNEACRIASELQGPTWVLAHEQTSARGRRGREWSMPKGNFAATLILQPNEPPAEAALRSFVMSLALYQAFVAVTGRDNLFALKWPNDVLLKGGKVAGILLESIGQGGQLSHLAIGVGINLVASPSPDRVEPGALRPVSLSAETGIRITAEAFLDILAQEYAVLETQYQTYGFDPIRTAWLAHAARIGEVVTARTTRDETVGTFEDIGPAGTLILQTAKGRVSIAAADVYF